MATTSRKACLIGPGLSYFYSQLPKEGWALEVFPSLDSFRSCVSGPLPFEAPDFVIINLFGDGAPCTRFVETLVFVVDFIREIEVGFLLLGARRCKFWREPSVSCLFRDPRTQACRFDGGAYGGSHAQRLLCLTSLNGLGQYDLKAARGTAQVVAGTRSCVIPAEWSLLACEVLTREFQAGQGDAAFAVHAPAVSQHLLSGNWGWKWVHRWTWPAHINILEACAYVKAAERTCFSVGRLGRQHLILSDSSAVVGAINKGRSSSGPLNRACRQVAALSLAFDQIFLTRWISTHVNPADAPSRIFN